MHRHEGDRARYTRETRKKLYVAKAQMTRGGLVKIVAGDGRPVSYSGRCSHCLTISFWHHSSWSCLSHPTVTASALHLSSLSDFQGVTAAEALGSRQMGAGR